ncbi:MAG: archaemetzincin family Zn-dependent metalloprotease [Promethearchaeota archaeon]
MVGLRIYGFENTPSNLLAGIKKTLDNQFSQLFNPVSLHPELLPVPEDAYDSKRRQYRAQPFLDTLDTFVPPDLHSLALVNYDLFVPRLNFIFGVAQPGGHALVALPRLRPSFYKLPTDDATYFERVTKEVIHELGHVLGLDHCTQFCVMRFSNTLADTDQKPGEYCQSCKKALG